MTSFNLNYLHKGLISKYSHITSWGFNIWIWVGITNIQSITLSDQSYSLINIPQTCYWQRLCMWDTQSEYTVPQIKRVYVPALGFKMVIWSQALNLSHPDIMIWTQVSITSKWTIQTQGHIFEPSSLNLLFFSPTNLWGHTQKMVFQRSYLPGLSKSENKRKIPMLGISSFVYN